jgi:hypothetical protein
MRVEIIEKIKTFLQQNTFTPTSLNGTELYTYDDNNLKRTIFTDILPENANYLKVENTNYDEFISHICVDGDLIEHGKEKYNNYSVAYSDGRNDCILINDATFLFIEFKLEQLEISFDNEKRKWKTFKNGAEQIIEIMIHYIIMFLNNQLRQSFVCDLNQILILKKNQMHNEINKKNY